MGIAHNRPLDGPTQAAMDFLSSPPHYRRAMEMVLTSPDLAEGLRAYTAESGRDVAGVDWPKVEECIRGQ
jgi:hypothetical protein